MIGGLTVTYVGTNEAGVASVVSRMVKEEMANSMIVMQEVEEEEAENGDDRERNLVDGEAGDGSIEDSNDRLNKFRMRYLAPRATFDATSNTSGRGTPATIPKVFGDLDEVAAALPGAGANLTVYGIGILIALACTMLLACYGLFVKDDGGSGGGKSSSKSKSDSRDKSAGSRKSGNSNNGKKRTDNANASNMYKEDYNDHSEYVVPVAESSSRRNYDLESVVATKKERKKLKDVAATKEAPLVPPELLASQPVSSQQPNEYTYYNNVYDPYDANGNVNISDEEEEEDEIVVTAKGDTGDDVDIEVSTIASSRSHRSNRSRRSRVSDQGSVSSMSHASGIASFSGMSIGGGDASSVVSHGSRSVVRREKNRSTAPKSLLPPMPCEDDGVDDEPMTPLSSTAAAMTVDNNGGGSVSSRRSTVSNRSIKSTRSTLSNMSHRSQRSSKSASYTPLGETKAKEGGEATTRTVTPTNKSDCDVPSDEESSANSLLLPVAIVPVQSGFDSDALVPVVTSKNGAVFFPTNDGDDNHKNDASSLGSNRSNQSDTESVGSAASDQSRKGGRSKKSGKTRRRSKQLVLAKIPEMNNIPSSARDTPHHPSRQSSYTAGPHYIGRVSGAPVVVSPLHAHNISDEVSATSSKSSVCPSTASMSRELDRLHGRMNDGRSVGDGVFDVDSDEEDGMWEV